MREDETAARAHAKRLRRSMTHAETLVWGALRRNAMHGLRFRRQHPIGPYIADFACASARLVVEVDGATHWTPAQLAHDQARSAFLMAAGWRVLRVTNTEVYEDLDGVWRTIEALLPPFTARGELQ